MNQPELQTERLLLRPFRLADAGAVQQLAGNYNISKMTSSIPFPYEPGMAEAWINTHAADREARKRIHYAAIKRDSGELLGAVSLVHIEGSEGELGYWIGEPFWGLGYATEAAAELVRFSLDGWGLEKIVAQHLTVNPASGKVLQKLGMRHVLSTQKLDRHGKDADMEIYEMHQSERIAVRVADG